MQYTGVSEFGLLINKGFVNKKLTKKIYKNYRFFSFLDVFSDLLCNESAKINILVIRCNIRLL